MKTSFQKISILILFFFYSCVQTDDFDIPKADGEASLITANSNILAVKNAYEQFGESIYTFDEKDGSVIEGYVISSDEAGNFFKTLIIQDDYENPVSGIEILIDLKSYFTKFDFGRKIFIKMAGLSVVNNQGKYKIGYNLRGKVEEIPESILDNYIVRSTIIENIIPKKITLSEIQREQIGTYVQMDGVQFRKDEIGKTFAGEAFDEFNGERILIQCNNQISAILSTSTYADFKSSLLSEKTGSIQAILTKDYYAEKYVFILNHTSTIQFTEGSRCDPDFLNCVSVKNPESNVLFFENFQEIKKTRDLEDLGWKNSNVYFGNAQFKKRTSQENVSMQISAYNTGESPLEVWLVTPPVHLDGTSNEILTFDTKASYDNGTALTAWVSTDMEANIIDANWQQLEVAISVGPGNNYVNEYVSSGEISLDCLEGDVFIAFKYTGGDPGISTTYDLDNVMIRGD